MTARTTIALICLWGGLLAGTVWAVDIETVPVGDPGNAGDTRVMWGDGTTGYGSVGYTYNIGKYEVTAGQYAAFLNAVAKTDTYGLYHTSMWTSTRGCKIQCSGSWGNYTYSVAPDWADRPVSGVTWGDAARFANWLHNGQPTGPQGLNTTEDGAYYLNGATDNAALLVVTRQADWRWAITSEDEWYKAAYYKGGSANAGYFGYPTGSDAVPGQDLDDISGNNANYCKDLRDTIGSPYYRTEVGEFQNSESPYGTFDQGGNVWEWNEAVSYGSQRGLRGGSFFELTSNDIYLHASSRSGRYPGMGDGPLGFRVSAADTDGDGIIDSNDQCPNTIGGIEVGTEGCPPLILGDFDRDGDVDGVDVGAFAACGSGPAASISAGCEIADFDGDTDVDQEDFGIFQACISGENTPGSADCLLPAGMVLIPAGEFQMGNSFPGEGYPDELPRHAVYVSRFYMDRYEVTNAQYCDALNWAYGEGLIHVSSGMVYGTGDGQIYCDTATSSGYSGIQHTSGVFSVTSGRANHPMVMVSWYGAAAYANWRSVPEGRQPCYTSSGDWTCDFSSKGYRLPTEAEWEKAARGGAAGRRFPWSDQDSIQHARANYYSVSSGYDNNPTAGLHPVWNGTTPRTSPVGFFDGALRQKADFDWPGDVTSYQTANGANGYGLYDMAGNVWEWCNDRHSDTYYSSPEASQPNPRGPASASFPIRVLRGAGWDGSGDFCRVANRGNNRAASRSTSGGFRLALSAP